MSEGFSEEKIEVAINKCGKKDISYSAESFDDTDSFEDILNRSGIPEHKRKISRWAHRNCLIF